MVLAAAETVATNVAGREFQRPDLMEMWDEHYPVSKAATEEGLRCVDTRGRPYEASNGYA